MKKIGLLLTLITLFSRFSFAELQVKAGMNLSSNYNNSDFQAGLKETFKIEYFCNSSNEVSIGLGLGSQTFGEIEINNQEELYVSNPVFISFRYIDTDYSTFFLKMNLGYSLTSTEENDYDSPSKFGWYYGVGAGFDLNNFLIEFIYEDLEIESDELGNINSSKLALEIGYSFK